MKQGQIHYYTAGISKVADQLIVVDKEEYKLCMRIERCRQQWRFEIAREIGGVKSNIELYLEQDELDAIRNYLNNEY